MSSPFILVIGAPKLGKSTEALKAFQNSLFITTSTNTSHYFKRLLSTKYKDNPNYKPPKKIKLIDTHSTGVSDNYDWLKPGQAKSKFGKLIDGQLVPADDGTILLPVNQMQEFERTISSVTSQSLSATGKGEAAPYGAVIVDELGELLDRVHSEILPTCLTNTGKIDTRGAFMATGEWVGRIVTLMRQLVSCGVGICLVLHDKEPDGSKKGGPKTPSASIAKKLIALSDGCIQRVIKDPETGAVDDDGKPQKPRRIWRAMASEQWDIGLRGLEPEDEEKIADMELKEILELCGYDM